MDIVFHLKTKKAYAESLIRHLINEGALEELEEETLSEISDERLELIRAEREKFLAGDGEMLTWEQVKEMIYAAR